MLFVVFLMIFFIKHKNWALSSEMTSGWLLGPYGMGLKPSSDACKANDLLTVLLFQSLKGIVNAIGSLKKICWRLHPWLLSWWLYLETGSYFADVIKVLGVILHSKWQRAEETKKMQTDECRESTIWRKRQRWEWYSQKPEHHGLLASTRS